MLKHAVMTALLSLLAGIVGFTHLMPAIAGIAQVLFVVLLCLTIGLIVMTARGSGHRPSYATSGKRTNL